MSDEQRASLTGGLWFFSALALMALFISAAVQRELTFGHVVIAFVILALDVVGTVYFSSLRTREAAQDKAKGQRIDGLLHDLSDEELIILRQRLLDVDPQRETIANYLEDDGELALRK
ncbi:MAG: hypothetical protein GYB67_18395 [Chloroflexi bacterium]|nr:hypothetical protein [Chloroflexota bacterium]